MTNRIAKLTMVVVLSVGSLGLTCLGQFSGAYAYSGPVTFDNLGRSVSGSGDVNNDGFDDVIVGAFRDDDLGKDSGSARVFSGLDGSILYTFYGNSAGDFFGAVVSDAGDVNQDGYADLIIGAHFDGTLAQNGGSAWVYSGFDGSLLYSFFGTQMGDTFGNSVSGAGDVNNDGFDDVIIGISDAASSNSTIPQAGRVVVYSGADGSLLHMFDIWTHRVFRGS